MRGGSGKPGRHAKRYPAAGFFEPSPRPIGKRGNPVHGASPISNIVIPAKQATRHSIYCASMRHAPIQT
ncbi:hypothetical protein BCEP4_700049 [Burkholderia cepacia]|nr:hypothetical protein BCEP4_700049 [Burkholderia cepacia]